jgi:putative DNA primase/helicase
LNGNGQDMGRARDALHAIPPDLPRDEWVRAGMAAQAAGLSFDDFNAWSAQAGNYEEQAARDSWRSFKPGKGIGSGTLYRMAAEHRPAKSASRHARPSKATAKPAESTTPLRPGMGAAEVWARCNQAPVDHPYITAKSGRPDGLRVVPDGDPLRISGSQVAGWLVVPVLPLDGGEPASLQFIPPPGAGKKLNLPGAQVAGVFIVGDMLAGDSVFLCEGIGQAWACWTATGAAAVVCFGWGRVRAVAAELRQRDPSARLVLVPDVGKEADAEAIALEVGAAVAAMPEGWPGNSDVNDLAQREGFDALEVLLAGAGDSLVAPALPPLPFSVVPFADLATAEPAPPGFVWEGLIPAGHVTMLAAHGGTGKSMIALMLVVSVAMGLPLFGIPTRKGAAAFFSGEDGAGLLRFRLRMVCRCLGVRAEDLAGRLFILDATDDDPTLFTEVTTAGRREGVTTRTYDSLREFLAAHDVSMLVVDNASDVFDASEIDRARVRGFMRTLARIARERDAGVLLLAHVDKGTSRGDRGQNSEGYSGSTAWSNSARSRLFMSRDKDGALLLEHQKTNLGKLASPLRLTWPEGGLPQADVPVNGFVQHIADSTDAKALLKLIHEFYGRGEFVATDTRSRYHAAKVLGAEPAFPKRRKPHEIFKMLAEADQRGLLKRETYRDGNRKAHERWALTAAGLAHIGAAAPSARCAPKYRR